MAGPLAAQPRTVGYGRVYQVGAVEAAQVPRDDREVIERPRVECAIRQASEPDPLGSVLENVIAQAVRCPDTAREIIEHARSVSASLAAWPVPQGGVVSAVER